MGDSRRYRAVIYSNSITNFKSIRRLRTRGKYCTYVRTTKHYGTVCTVFPFGDDDNVNNDEDDR